MSLLKVEQGKTRTLRTGSVRGSVGDTGSALPVWIGCGDGGESECRDRRVCREQRGSRVGLAPVSGASPRCTQINVNNGQYSTVL